MSFRIYTIMSVALAASVLTLSCRRMGSEELSPKLEEALRAEDATNITDWSAKIPTYAYLPGEANMDSANIYLIVAESEDKANLEDGTIYPLDKTSPDKITELTSLTPEKTYYYRVCIQDGDTVLYSDIKSFTTAKTADDVADHALVDLGLSVRWATCNLGAKTETDFGDYFAWGVPSSENKDFTWSNYKWYNSADKTVSKYSTVAKCGAVDGLTVLESEDDPATAAWGSSWRTPTESEINELLIRCSVSWTMKTVTVNNEVIEISGLLVANRRQPRISIFLPAAGYKKGKELVDSGKTANYWSSSLFGGNSYYARYLGTSMETPYVPGIDRFIGMSIRPVAK